MQMAAKVNRAGATAVVQAAYEGLLRRPADSALEHYVDRLVAGDLTIAQLLQYFVSLNEFYERVPLADRKRAIASLHGTEGQYADPYTWSPSTGNLVFFHFPKSAGMSIRRAISRFYHPLQIGSEVAIRETKGAAGRHQRFFSWHMTWQQYLHLPQPTVTFTALRNPRDRLVSLYRFLKAIGRTALPPYLTGAVATESGQSAFFASDNPEIINQVDNCYVRTLAEAYAGPDGDPLRSDPSRALELAVERVLQFDEVYFLDEVAQNGGKLPPRLVKRLSEVLQTDFPSKLPVENVNEVGDVELVEARHLEQNSTLDMEFCRLVAQRLAIQVNYV